MREVYSQILKEHICKHISLARANLHMTQAQISAVFCMDPRSYICLEHGDTCCGALTLVLFLNRCCDDPLQVLNELDEAFRAADKAMEEANTLAAV